MHLGAQVIGHLYPPSLKETCGETRNLGLQVENFRLGFQIGNFKLELKGKCQSEHTRHKKQIQPPHSNNVCNQNSIRTNIVQLLENNACL